MTTTTPDPSPAAARDASRRVVAANVRAEVSRQSLSRATIATKLGLSRRAVSRRMLAEVDWTATDLAVLARLLGCSTDDLVGHP